jgi:hypothetical protein
LYETSVPHDEEGDYSDISPCFWKDVEEKMNVTFTSGEYMESDDNLIPYAVHEIDSLCIEDKNIESDDKEDEVTAFQ